jgi:SAM-dependent methyltransferase
LTDFVPADALAPFPSAQPSCAICGALRGTFSEYFGRPAVRCEGCGSLERHRAFYECCKHGFGEGWTMRNKALLLVSPNPSENLALRREAGSVRTLDVRLDVRADYHEDLCHVPALADASFDVIVAHHVFAHVRDDRLAFAEAARLLRPQGRLFFTTPLEASGVTREIVDIAEVTRLWGMDAYERYGVGTFRRYGQDDLVARLEESFRVIVHVAHDSATAASVTLFECIRKAAEGVNSAERELRDDLERRHPPRTK